MEHSRSYVTERQRRIAQVTMEKHICDVRWAFEGVGRCALGSFLGKQKRTSETNSKVSCAKGQIHPAKPEIRDGIVISYTICLLLHG